MALRLELSPIEKGMIGMLSGIIVAFLLLDVAQALVPTPPAPPQRFICPIDGLEFPSLEELEAHFRENHPTEPIEIIWGE